MDKFFFSNKNVARQCGNLENIIDIPNNERARKRCKGFLVQHMKDVYRRYGKKRPPGMKVPQFIDKLNKQSLKECVKLINDKKQKNSYSPAQINNLERRREVEMHGKRPMRVPDRPSYTGMERGNVDSGMPGFSDGVGSSGFCTTGIF